jgi:hypothetical protein
VQIQVKFQGTEHTLPDSGLADMVAFERHFGLSSSVLGGESESGQRVEWMCFLVYRGLRKLNVIAKDVPFDDDFLEGIDTFDVKDDDEAEAPAADPSVPAAALG